MTIGWAGAFDGLTNWPPDHTSQGWSNYVSAVAALFTRYRDGDFLASALWRELAGNLNFHLAQSRQHVWMDDFVASTAGATDPTYVHTANDWTTTDAIYCITPPIPLIPNVLRGPESAPRLACKARARRNGGASNTTVRVYSVNAFAGATRGWTGVADPLHVSHTADITAGNGYPADPGYSSEETLEPCVWWTEWRHPALAAGEGEIVIRVPWTILVLAGAGTGANGPLIASVQVREEVVAS